MVDLNLFISDDDNSEDTSDSDEDDDFEYQRLSGESPQDQPRNPNPSDNNRVRIRIVRGEDNGDGRGDNAGVRLQIVRGPPQPQESSNEGNSSEGSSGSGNSSSPRIPINNDSTTGRPASLIIDRTQRHGYIAEHSPILYYIHNCLSISGLRRVHRGSLSKDPKKATNSKGR